MSSSPPFQIFSISIDLINQVFLFSILSLEISFLSLFPCIISFPTCCFEWSAKEWIRGNEAVQLSDIKYTYKYTPKQPTNQPLNKVKRTTPRGEGGREWNTTSNRKWQGQSSDGLMNWVLYTSKKFSTKSHLLLHHTLTHSHTHTLTHSINSPQQVVTLSSENNPHTPTPPNQKAANSC
jgi:hypothetical protein